MSKHTHWWNKWSSTSLLSCHHHLRNIIITFNSLFSTFLKPLLCFWKYRRAVILIQFDNLCSGEAFNSNTLKITDIFTFISNNLYFALHFPYLLFLSHSFFFWISVQLASLLVWEIRSLLLFFILHPSMHA